MQQRRKRLGDLLIDAGVLTQEQLETALKSQKTTGERLGKELINLGFITEMTMIQALEFQLGIPHIDMSEMVVASDVASLIPGALAERYQIIPIRKEGPTITLAMVDPTNLFAIDDVHMITGCNVSPVIAVERDIVRAINQAYGIRDLVDKAVNRLRPEDVTVSDMETTEDAPVVSIVNSLISQAVKERASDIHIEPLERYIRVRLRIDGVLREVVTFPRTTHAAIVSRIKIMGEMDISEKRLPQDGRAQTVEQGREIDLRISTTPTILGEKVVIRVLDKQAVVLDVGNIGFSRDNLACYRLLYAQSYGMVLVTGPTGSGKTTTLYATLTELNTPVKNIITIEDPVEYRLDGINQIQVNQKAGLTFANGLRSILRQDPNIVMVGEIRDLETAQIAVRSALTGQLVFSTLHTNDAAGAITRLVDMGIEPFLVASSVLGVVAQRLVRLICPDCKISYTPAPDSFERTFLELKPDDKVQLFKGSGCQHCGQTGYRGRMAIHEVMTITGALRELIENKVSSEEMAAQAKKEGMITMRMDGIAKAYQGLTTVAEVMRVAFSSV